MTPSDDTFARATARHAHTTSTEALAVANAALELARKSASPRRRMFVGLCPLCGAPCKPTAGYCNEHEWAA